MHILLFCSEEDNDIIESSLHLLNVVLKIVSKEQDEIFNVVKLVLYALSRKSFPETTKQKVINSLESFLCSVSQEIFHSREFSINTQPMQDEIQVCFLCKNCVCVKAQLNKAMNFYYEMCNTQTVNKYIFGCLHSYVILVLLFVCQISKPFASIVC